MVTDIVKRSMRYVPLLIYFLIILFITLFIRDVGLSRITNIVPFSSYRKAITGNAPMLRQVLLNVGLFIPYGWLVIASFRKKRIFATLGIIIVTSLLIETLQYITYRGQFDIDDLISNTVGGVIGIAAFLLVGRGRKLQAVISAMLIVVGVAGCIYTVRTKVGKDYTQYFDFRVESVTFQDGALDIHGQCYMYDRDTPQYTLTLVQEDLMGSRYDAEVVTGDKLFEVRAPVNPDSKYEIIVSFDGYPKMSTGVWLRVGKNVGVEYVAGDVDIPVGVPVGAVLKAYSEQYDTYVFETDGKVLWLIGRQDLNSNTEIIYHIRTNEPEKLPEKRKQYGFDNRGFRAKKDAKHANEVDGIGHYRVFEVEIPTEYHVTEIVVGFNTDGNIVWKNEYRVR